MKKIVKVVLLLVFGAIVSAGVPSASSMLGVSTYSATKVVDAIFMGASAGTIIMLIAAGGGFLGLGFGVFKAMVKMFGRSTAIYW